MTARATSQRQSAAPPDKKRSALDKKRSAFSEPSRSRASRRADFHESCQADRGAFAAAAHLVYAASQRLYLRALRAMSGVEPQPRAGTETGLALSPAFSPDKTVRSAAAPR
jgi:hypothetical protein